MSTIALAGLSGCSIAFVDAPPTDHASRHFIDCTSSMLAPGLDAALTATLALAVLGETSDGSRDAQSIVESSALVVGALASATYGYLRVSHCRQAKEALAERMIDMPSLGVPPVSAPPHAGGARDDSPRAPTGGDAGDRTHAPGTSDPWLSEGPPPESLRAPPLIPPPYLRLAPPVPPVPAAPPPVLLAPTPVPAPTPAAPAPAPAPADAGSAQ